MPKHLKKTNYTTFRNMVQLQAGEKIKSRGKTTLLYNHRNQVVAALRSACIDTTGRAQPAEYFVAA